MFYHFTHFTYIDYFERQAFGGFPIVGVFDGRGKARDCDRALKTSERGRANAVPIFVMVPHMAECGFVALPVYPVQLTTCRTGNLTRLIHTLAICDDHTYYTI